VSSAEKSELQSSDGPETNGLALTSLFLGIFWIFGLGSIIAIYLGHRALKEIEASGGEQSGGAFAWAGIVSGIFGLISLGLVIAIAIGPKS
jgi:hypothetical protein